MAARPRLLFLQALLGLIACESAVDLGPSETSTGASSTEDPAPGDTSGSGSTTSPSESSSSTSTDETGVLGSSTSTTSGTTGEGPAKISICQYQCVADEDCWQDGSSIGLSCSESGSCIASCETDEFCSAVFSGWLTQQCTANDECVGGVCVDFGQADGTGGCGLAPSEGLSCGEFGLEETDVTDIAGNAAVVCSIEAECSETEHLGRACVPVGDFGPNCARDGCAEGLVCRDDGLCGCEDDDACTLSGSGGTCVHGICLEECTSTEECGGPSPFDGGGFVCAPLDPPR
ncbi:MAG: hypothetical protein ACRBN8_28940 [Nannocystales bacterium]